jgi:hypothetical protein
MQLEGEQARQQQKSPYFGLREKNACAQGLKPTYQRIFGSGRPELSASDRWLAWVKNTSPLQCPLYCGRRQSVGCYFLPFNGNHLRPRPAFLSFFMGLAFLAPQTREPTAAPPNLTTHALRKLIGSGGTMIWWHR